MGASASVVEMVGDEGRDRSGSELRDSERKENKDLVESDESSHYVQNFGNDGVVDHFVKEMYMSSPKIDALQHVLSSDMGRIAFMEFLRTEYAEENLSFFIAVNAMKKTGDSKNVACLADQIVRTYLQPGVPTEINISDTLRNSITSMVSGERLSTRVELFDAFNAAQNETIKMMAMGAFPRFLRSQAFIQYRAQNHTADVAVQEKMSEELDLLLTSTSWLSHLLNSVEKLPICVSLAAASKQLSGFPLIYVNAAFEKTTGYPRSEIIGQNCRFLQMGKEPGHFSEEESIMRMSAALRDGKQIKIAITNFRKDGTPFRNLLAMKPIFDHHGNYAFVLGIQFDIGDRDASPKKMKIIDDLFRVLPDTILSGPSPKF